ncbi:hypothetical protein BDY17DRAFT_240794, partial [Neohortaea acidophila]
RSEVSFVKTTLPYPVFAADFDPYNRGYLVVGGGGGESRSGVPNQISVLDVSERGAISNLVDIELSRDEDSVQSLSCLSTRDGLIVLAGINSSQADQNARKNEHFRSFSVRCPPRKKSKTDEASPDEKGGSKLIGKRSLFQTSTAPKQETYQRLLRLSPSRQRPTGSSRIGAIATGFAKDSEIVVFDATTPTPEAADILTRIGLPEGAEAVDVDINESDDAVFSLAYCTDYDIYEQAFEYEFKTKRTQKTPNGPRRVHELPVPEDKSPRPKIRCLRFVNSQNVVALLNKPNRSGVELRVYHLYPTGPAILVQQQSLPRRMKQAVSMDVCALDADREGNQQIIIAVAGQDISIELYTTNYQRRTDTFTKFRSYLTLRDVHEHQMTKICFSPYHATVRAPEKSDDDETAPPRAKALKKYVRLASVSMGNTVAVDALPLSSLETKDKQARYILSHPSDELWTQWTQIAMISTIALIFAYLVQSYYYNTRNSSASPTPSPSRQFQSTLSPIESAPASARLSQRLHSLLATHKAVHPTVADPHAPTETALVLRPDAASTGVTLDVHPDKEALLQQGNDEKHWHELGEDQKTAWKERLKHAGHWAEDEGEAIFQGILFSEYAGMVGQAAAEVVREL